jgi:hypothetical protein
VRLSTITDERANDSINLSRINLYLTQLASSRYLLFKISLLKRTDSVVLSMKLLAFTWMLLSITFAATFTAQANVKYATLQTAPSAMASTSIITAQVSSADDEMGNPIILVGLLLVMLVLMAIAAAALAFTGFLFGTSLAVLIFLAIWTLISLRVLSASAKAAWHGKLIAPGFKRLMLSLSVITGMVVCGSVSWFLNRLLHLASAPTAIVGGVVSGALAGITFGFGVYYFLCRLTRR